MRRTLSILGRYAELRWWQFSKWLLYDFCGSSLVGKGLILWQARVSGRKLLSPKNLVHLRPHSLMQGTKSLARIRARLDKHRTPCRNKGISRSKSLPNLTLELETQDTQRCRPSNIGYQYSPSPMHNSSLIIVITAPLLENSNSTSRSARRSIEREGEQRHFHPISPQRSIGTSAPCK